MATVYDTTVYEAGDGIEVTATVTDLAGALADPTLMVFRLRDPSGSITTPPVVRTSLGKYYVYFTVSVSGDWSFRWEATGNVQVTERGRVSVRQANF